MSIELRQHKDGSYTIEITDGYSRREVDVTHVINEILVEKLRSLKARVRADEKYLNWVVEAAQHSKTALSAAYVNYQQITERLKQTNEAIRMVLGSWNQKNEVRGHLKSLEKVERMNNHFLENDGTLAELKRLAED